MSFSTMRQAISQKVAKLIEGIKERPKLSIAVTAALVLSLAIRQYQTKLIYFPILGNLPKSPRFNPSSYRHPSKRGLESDDIELKSQDGVILRGWHIKHKNPERLIVFFHQNAGNIGTRLAFVKILLNSTSSDVLLVAYRGYSDSQGSPNQKGIKKDAKAILEKGLELGTAKNIPVVVYGRSLGGAAAIYACSFPELGGSIKGIILQNTFTSIRDVAINLFPKSLSIMIKIMLWFLLTNKWQSHRLISTLRKPVFFIKSERDELIPKKQMDRLQQLCEMRSYEFIINEGTHNQTWSLDPDLYFKELSRFLSTL